MNREIEIGRGEALPRPSWASDLLAPIPRRALLGVLRGVSLVAMLTLSVAVAARADCYDSGAEVLSNGDVHGYAVTSYPGWGYMYHNVWATITLTSPVKHRQAYGSANYADSVQADATLSFDPDDLGQYSVSSLHSAYCSYCMCWLIQDVPSWAYASLRMTKWVALTRIESTPDWCGYAKSVRYYTGLDDSGWIPNNEYWVLFENLNSKDQSCGEIQLGSATYQVGSDDLITIGCSNPTSCVYETDQTWRVAPNSTKPLTPVRVKNCVGLSASACREASEYAGYHVRATYNQITVTNKQ